MTMSLKWMQTSAIRPTTCLDFMLRATMKATMFLSVADMFLG